MCAVICRKATLRFPKPISSLPGANPYLCEHKIEVFVRFCPSEPPFSGVSSTKSRFLCFFDLRDPRFRAFRAQNRGFCAFWGSGAPVFGCFEHKIEVFVLFGDLEPSFSSISSTKSGFLCFFGLRDPCFQVFRAQNRGFCAFLPFGTLIFWYFEHKIGVFVLKRRGKWDRKT